MTSQPFKNARLIAAQALDKLDLQKSDFAGLFNELLKQTDQKQRATDIVYGTVRNIWAIDRLIETLADCPAKRIHGKILNIIRTGVYELVYCPETPDYSIVNEAVENVKKIASAKQTGFVNAVLRNILRGIENRQADLSEANPLKTLPQNLTQGCVFNKEILPDPAKSPVESFAATFSLPKWLIQDWLDTFSFDQVKQICFASNRRPGIYVRANVLKTTAVKLAETFQQAGIDCHQINDSVLKIKSPAAINELPGYADGLFTIQDLTASQTIPALKLETGWTYLDLCAAPGTKTAHLAELTCDNAKIFATDIDARRLKKIDENINRLGLKSITVFRYSELEKIKNEAGLFDCVLLDVPCSNTGVLSKRAQVRHRIDPKILNALVEVQNKLLTQGAGLLKPTGTICYSTCSIQKQENNLLIGKFLTENPRFTLAYENLTLPSAVDPDHDGGYTAIIRRD